MAHSARYFIPVCLYPHTKYRTAAGVVALFEKYRLASHDHLIVVADRLLVLDRLVTGRYFTVNSATAKARQEAEQIARLVRRVAHKSGAGRRGKVVFWDEIANADTFSNFSLRLKDAVSSDDLLATAMQEFVDRRVNRFGLGSDLAREREYEREYLLSEVCMSVYCTEILEFQTEIWERPPAPEIPDPLKLLYQLRSDLVTNVTGKPAARTLHFLFEETELGHASKEALAQD